MTATDPYLLANGVLANRQGIADASTLEMVEGVVTSSRYDQAIRMPAETVEDLRHIHAHLFGEIYAWAGQFRTCPLARQHLVDHTATTRFSSAQSIPGEMEHLFASAAKEHWRGEAAPAEYVDNLAAFMTAYNAIHPFRDGNGRTVRGFITANALARGFEFDFRVITEETNIRAAIAAGAKDLSLRRNALADALVPERRAALGALIGFLKIHYPNWNQRSIRCATQGETVSGRYFGAHQASASFTVATRDALVVAHLSDLPKAAARDEAITFQVRRPTFSGLTPPQPVALAEAR